MPKFKVLVWKKVMMTVEVEVEVPSLKGTLGDKEQEEYTEEEAAGEKAEEMAGEIHSDKWEWTLKGDDHGFDQPERL